MRMTSLTARITVKRDTTANWNLHPTFIPLRGELIIYTDAGTKDNKPVPKIKIGDGLAYVVDLPFVGEDTQNQILSELRSHTGDASIHVSAEDRNRWDDKLNYTLSGETLILNRE